MRWSYPQVVLVSLAVVVGVGVLIAASTSGTAFGSYNPSWEGTSELRALGEANSTGTTSIQETQSYSAIQPNGTVTFIIAPSTPYSETDISRLETYLRSGGTAVVAGDFGGTTNQLLAGLTVSTRVQPTVVRDEQRYGAGPALPIATNISSHPYTTTVGQLSLNYPATLTLDNSTATTLVRTSPFAYRDRNRNEQLDDNETLQQYPVVAVESLGQGSVIVVSDPSVFINSMLDEPDNRQFVRGIIDQHNRTILDVSHSGGLPPAIWVLTILRDIPVLQVFLGGLVLMGLIQWRWLQSVLSRRRGGEPKQQHESPQRDPVQLQERVRERHPDWDDQRIKRVAQTIMPPDSKDRHDE